MVSKATYAEAKKEANECQENLKQLQSFNHTLDRKISTLREQHEATDRENRILLEDLAALSAEQEELTRKVAQCKKQMEEREKHDDRIADTYAHLLNRLSSEIDHGDIHVDQADTRLKLNLVDKILFPSGSATLTPKGKQILEKVGYVLKEIKDRKIMIEGHTDDLPVSSGNQGRFHSNWDLSALRATAVVQYLQERVAIDPRLLSATGYSMYYPIAKNDSPEHRSTNRRIEIVLVPLTPQEMQRLYVTQEPTPPPPPKALSEPADSPPAVIPILP